MPTKLEEILKKSNKNRKKKNPSKYYQTSSSPEKAPRLNLEERSVTIQLATDIDDDKLYGSPRSRLDVFGRMHPIRGVNENVRSCFDCFMIPFFGWIESFIRLCWHLVLSIIFVLLTILTIFKVNTFKHLLRNNLMLMLWFLGGIFCCYIPLPCFDSEGWPWHYYEYYISSCCCVACCCYPDSMRRTWELFFPLEGTAIDFPVDFPLTKAVFRNLAKLCGCCNNLLRKII